MNNNKENLSMELVSDINYYLQKYPEIKDYLYNFFFFLRNHQIIIFYILTHISELNSNELFVNLISNNFYENILLLNYLDDEFLSLIFRLLKLEISQLKNTKNKKEFLLNSTCGNLLKEIGNNNEIKSFFNMLLKPIVENMEMQSEFKWEFHLNSIQEIIDNYKKKHGQNEINELYRPQIDMNDLRESISQKNSLLSDFNEIKKENEKRKKEEMELARKYFFDKYIPDLTKEELEKFMNAQNDIRMKDFCKRQLNRIQKDDSIYTNLNIIDQMMGVENSTEVLNLYQTYFSFIKNVIDSILNYLIENMHLIPYSIKCICKMISILIKNRFNDISEIEENSYIGNFFFRLLFFEIFKSPDYKGLISNFIISPQTKSNIETVIKIIGKLAKGNFFKATKNPEYTPFNWYFLYTMPLLLEFIDKLKNIELPSYVEKLCNGEINDIDFNYDYFLENKGEIIQFQTICFSLKNFENIFLFVYNNLDDIINMVNENEKQEFNNIITNLYRYHDHIKIFIQKEYSKSKNYHYLITKLILSPRISNSYNINENEDNLILNTNDINSKDILQKNLLHIQKYLYILLNEYKNLDKEDFSNNCTDSLNIIKEITELIKLKKIQKINKLKNSIPIEWYGISIINLLEQLPDEYKENDYNKVYEEFEKNLLNTMNNFDFGQLGEISEKLKSIHQLQEILKQNKNLLNTAIINNKILTFIEEYPVNISFKIIDEETNKIDFYCSLDNYEEQKKKDKSKNNEYIFCKTIKELIDKFPNFADYISTRVNEVEFDNIFSDNFIILKNKIKKYSSKYFNNELESEIINEKIMDFFMSSIYDKLFKNDFQENNHNFYQKCVSCSWIELKDLIGENNLILDNFLPISISYIKDIEIARTPKKKLDLITSIKRVISDTYVFNTGKPIIEVDEFLPSFAFSLIKAKPKKSVSNLNFIKVFYDSSKEQSVTFFESAIQFIISLDHTKLKNISQEEFEKRCQEINIENQ